MLSPTGQPGAAISRSPISRSRTTQTTSRSSTRVCWTCTCRIVVAIHECPQGLLDRDHGHHGDQVESDLMELGGAEAPQDVRCQPPTQLGRWALAASASPLRNAPTPTRHEEPPVQLGSVPQFRVGGVRGQRLRPGQPGAAGRGPQGLPEVRVRIGRLHSPQRPTEPGPDLLQMPDIPTDRAVRRPCRGPREDEPGPNDRTK